MPNVPTIAPGPDDTEHTPEGATEMLPLITDVHADKENGRTNDTAEISDEEAYAKLKAKRAERRSKKLIRRGIAAGIVLGVGRAIGEAMAVMMVAGNSPNMPDSVFRSVTFLTTAIAKEMSYAGGLQRQALFSIALVLFVFIMIINVVLNVALKGGDRDA